MNDQKLENLLNLALDATPEEIERSERLAEGYDRAANTWDLIIKYHGDLTGLEREGAAFTPLVNEYAIVTIDQELIPWLASRVQVEYIEKPKRLSFAVDQGRAASCINGLSRAPLGLTGKGVLLAIIDSGIDYTHPDFRNADGTTRLLALWDQTIEGMPPKGYRIGTEFTREELNQSLRENRVLSRDLSGHGTAVAGIAAGNGRASKGKYRGVAPESELLVVKLGIPRPDSFPRTTELIQGVDYAVRKALELSMPLVINLSFGNTYGSHDGTSLLETFLDDISGYGRSCMVVGTGNEGEAGGHTGGWLTEGEEKTLELAIGEYETGTNIQLWKSYVDNFSVSLISPEGMTIGPFRENMGSQRYRVEGTEVLVYYGEPSPYSMAQEIYMDLLSMEKYIDSGIWKILLTPGKIVEGRYDLWLPSKEERNQETYFYRPDPETTLTIPSTAGKVISVGAYDSRLMTYAAFSGRGYTRDGRTVKPDLSAPGVDIMATAPGGGYTPRTGTSFAAPFVSGSAALLMQWGIVDAHDPYLYGAKMKAWLLKGARPLPVVKNYPDPRLGYGTLCSGPW